MMVEAGGANAAPVLVLPVASDGDQRHRVRRLAYLKRQRRALVDAEKKRGAVAEKLETCALALQNMRFDMMRLSASPQMHQHITSLANKALSLAEGVDEAVYVADEMGRVGSARGSGTLSRTAGSRPVTADTMLKPAFHSSFRQRSCRISSAIRTGIPVVASRSRTVSNVQT